MIRPLKMLSNAAPLARQSYIKTVILCLLALVAAMASASATAAADQGAAESTAWRQTLERIAPGVVAIKVDVTRAFDTGWNESGQATGFVVDAKRGLILTNRHVVSPGPVRAVALFVNQEEVELTPVYRDPVHDFGFFRYDPQKLRYITPAELPLFPEGAQLGSEIRVVGNDASEQLSILSGTIARLHRMAPDYGSGNYNDFNTFYLQAASGTSGGSSGSPVINRNGQVVALNAGRNAETASSFFLPLERVQRALTLIQAGQPVSRATLATIFSHQPFAELRRLGLREQTQAAIRQRFADQTGMLVVSQVIPGSVADGVLRVGDILVTVDGDFVTEFAPLEAVLDQNVNKTVRLGLDRQGQSIEISIAVQDLEPFAPAQYLEFGGAVVHALSLQQARHYNRPMAGIYVANPGYVLAVAGIGRASIITSVNGQPVNTLDELESVLATLSDRQRAPVRFYTFDEPATSKLRVMLMDRRWFAAQRCQRDDASGVWPCRALAGGPVAKPGPTQPVRAEKPAPQRRTQAIASSLVGVQFDMPYPISGIAERNYFGTGVVVDAQRGYVVVDRNTVPEAMGDVQLTFAGTLEIPARVVYVHPTHNLTLLAYDPALIGAIPVQAARLSDQLPRPGETVQVAGLRNDFKPVYRSTQVASVNAVWLALSPTNRFRETNMETLALVNAPTDHDGVILNRHGDVVALWSSFSFQGPAGPSQETRGIPAQYVRELQSLARFGKELISLEVEWFPMPLASARKLGLSEDWVNRLKKHDAQRPQVQSVLRTVAGTPAAKVLEPGDILLSVDGKPVTRVREVELAGQKPSVELLLLRGGKTLALQLPTVSLGGQGVRHALMWSGALIQAHYRDMAAQRAFAPYGVYVAYAAHGSPASRYGQLAGRRIVAVDERPTPDLVSFVNAVRGKPDRQAVRLTTLTHNNRTEVLTLKIDATYWPSYEIVWGAAGCFGPALGSSACGQVPNWGIRPVQ